jgi:hypothetical protein
MVSFFKTRHGHKAATQGLQQRTRGQGFSPAADSPLLSKKRTHGRSARWSETEVHTPKSEAAHQEKQTEGDENRHWCHHRHRSEEQMTLRYRRHQTLMVLLVRIRMEEMMKLIGSGQTQQSQPETQHQDTNDNPAATADPRCVSCLQVVPF